MADIELVIKIPEEEYKNICLMSKDGIGMALYDWIANGTPLPKGHGRLIDEKVAYKKFYSRCLARVATEVFAEMQAIIEADKIESEE